MVEDFFPPSCDCRNINQKHSIIFLAQETKASCEEAEPGLSLLALSLGERCVLSWNSEVADPAADAVSALLKCWLLCAVTPTPFQFVSTK